MTTQAQMRFAPHGPVAIMPRAFGIVVSAPPEPPKNETRDGVVIVSARGPLNSHANDPCLDSYDAIRARIAEALVTTPRAIVLSIDSPGGLVAGCFEAARDIRSMCARANVPLHAYVNGMAASAAYALACAAQSITAPAEAIVGSIGVIDVLLDTTRQDAALGMQFTVVTSGARKADGNPHAPTTDASIAAAEARVQSLASVFFDHVASGRPITASEVSALEAGLFHGDAAVKAGLVDQIATLDELLASLAGSTTSAAPSANASGATTMDEEEKKAMLASLRKAAESGDEKAKKALAAFEEEPSDDDKKKEEEAKAKAAAEEEEKKKEEEAKAKAAASATSDDPKAIALQAMAENRQLRAEIAAKEENLEREKLLATRPDITEDMRKLLRTEPLAKVQAHLAALPPLKPLRANAAAADFVQVTQGKSGSSKPDIKAARETLGIQELPVGIVQNGLRTQIYPMTPAEARAEIAARAARGGAR